MHTTTQIPESTLQLSSHKMSLSKLAEALRMGRLTSEQITWMYIDRINQYDDIGPELRAVTWLNPNAIAEAQEADRAIKNGKILSDLHGIPFLVKDNIDLKGIPTTAGSAAMQDAIPAEDAPVVQRLKAAGAIVLGKTNMSEFALSYGRLGYSSLGGLTRNPFNLKRNASGSSSGSAAAVAANFAPFSLGTDTAGSVRAPANTTGLVGLKPTRDLLPLDGIVPLSPTLDVVGPMTHSVDDLIVIMSSLDTSNVSAPADTDLPLKIRIGVVSSVENGNEEVSQIFRNAIGTLRDNGVEVIQISQQEFKESQWPVMARIVKSEFRPSLKEYLLGLTSGPKSLQEIITRSENDGRINPARLDGLKADMSYDFDGNSEQYAEDLETLENLRNALVKSMEEYNVDVFVFPTMTCPASPLYTVQDSTYSCNASDPYIPGYVANCTGLPELTMPAGFTTQGVPVGISLLGKKHSEYRIFAVAKHIEAILNIDAIKPNQMPFEGSLEIDRPKNQID